MRTLKLVCFSFLLSHFSDASELELSEALNYVEKQKLSEHKRWRRLLWYFKPWLRQEYGLVDSPGFYLAKDGKYDAKAELYESLRRLFKEASGDEKTLFQCRYPARAYWLAKMLGSAGISVPQVSCPHLESWVEKIDPVSVSLVFSSYYLDNPSSLFGHSFLRFHKRGNAKSTGLLDYAVNFAANPTTENPLFYTVLGLAGGFSGTFSLLPYYNKVQEYNNAESRDLWEYELNYSETEVKLMLLALWEMGPHWINYFYFDENCSYIILHLLDLGRPDYDFNRRLSGFVIPADTVKEVISTPGILRELHYRPSVFKRFRARYLALNDQEARWLRDLLDGGTDWSKQDQRSQAKVLDAALEYLEYVEKIYGPALPEQDKSRYHKILQARAQLNYRDESAPIVVPQGKAPHLGHKASRIGLGGQRTLAENYQYNLHLRPALHNIESLGLGYSNELEMQMGTIDLAYQAEDQEIFLGRFVAFGIRSLKFPRPLLGAKSWEGSLGYHDDYLCERSDHRCARIQIDVGFGRTFAILNEKVFGFGNLYTNAEFRTRNNERSNLGLGVHLGSYIKPVSKLSLSLRYKPLMHLGESIRYSHSSEFLLAFSLTEVFEINSFVRGYGDRWAAGGRVLIYF